MPTRPIDTGTCATGAHQTHLPSCQTTIIIGIMTTRVGKAVILIGRYLNREGFLTLHIMTLMLITPNYLHALDSYSSKQALTQMTLNSIQEYDGTNKDAVNLWLDHIKMVAEKTVLDPLEVRNQ